MLHPHLLTHIPALGCDDAGWPLADALPCRDGGDYMQRFEWSVDQVTRPMMDARIRTTVSAPGWQRSVGLLLAHGEPLERLHVAEAGCGSGPMRSP